MSTKHADLQNLQPASGMWSRTDGVHVRKARKEYKCRTLKKLDGQPTPDGCHTIAPGDTYLEVLWEAPGFGSGDRYCDVCAELALLKATQP